MEAGGRMRNLVLKNTFLETVEDSSDSGRLPRASSDSALYENSGQQTSSPECTPRNQDFSEPAEGEVEFDLTGLSDTETDPGAKGSRPLPCYSHIRESLPSSSGSTPRTPKPPALCVDPVDNVHAVSTPSPRSPGMDCAALLGAWGDVPEVQGHMISGDDEETKGASSSQGSTSVDGLRSIATKEDVQRLVNEVARLADENEALRQKFCNQTSLEKQSSQPVVVGPRVNEPRKEGRSKAASRGKMQVPELSQPAGSSSFDFSLDDRTTVMLRNVPNNYTRDLLLTMLDCEGFAGLYDFIYMPIDFKSQACLGYAFVNLSDPSVVPLFWSTFNGYARWVLPSRKVCSVSWSAPHQGLQEHVDRYRNSPVMHASVPDMYKPVLFENGVRVQFPEPSKAPRAPRVRNCRELEVRSFAPARQQQQQRQQQEERQHQPQKTLTRRSGQRQPAAQRHNAPSTTANSSIRTMPYAVGALPPSSTSATS